MQDRIPRLRSDIFPPAVYGTATLTTLAFSGKTIEQISRMLDDGTDPVAQDYDRAIIRQLTFDKQAAMALQASTLAQCQLFRIAAPPRTGRPLRLLAIMAPGDLMVNAPLDFITAHLEVQLDLLYLRPGHGLPDAIPDHDVAFFAISEADPALQARLRGLYDAWPRPVLNTPRHLPGFARDALAPAMSDMPSICCPPTRLLSRAQVAATTITTPVLIRPLGSHAGTMLAKLEATADIGPYLNGCDAASFYLSDFVDYRSADGLFRKYRVAFVDRAPFLCHMAVSENWMIHYLNAGMTESAAKRADEARAMATFDHGFARRHRTAFAALNDLFALDYYSIDCAELADGRLLMFEADTGAIIHMMDPPDLFPYKRPQMQRIFAAFGEMLRRNCLADA